MSRVRVQRRLTYLASDAAYAISLYAVGAGVELPFLTLYKLVRIVTSISICKCKAEMDGREAKWGKEQNERCGLLSGGEMGDCNP